MKKIDNFTGCYSLSRTLRFKLIPQGKTQEHIELKRLLDEDEKRAEDYKKAKKIIDKYHITFIDRILHNIKLSELQSYIELDEVSNKDEKQKKELLKIEELLRKEISNSFKKDDEYKKIFGKEIIETILPEYLDDQEEIEIIKSFKGFSTAFVGYWENRKNLYTDEEIGSSIAYRAINDNLPKFMRNASIFKSVEKIFSEEELREIKKEVLNDEYDVQDFFRKDFYDFLLPQDGIDIYNAILGGLVKEDGTKIRGLNEYINLYNQKNKEKNAKLKPLFKQVLTESESKSFYIDEFAKDEEVIEAFQDTFAEEGEVCLAIDQIQKLFNQYKIYDSNGIFIKNGLAVTALANDIYGSWSYIKEKWNTLYDAENTGRTSKESESYRTKREGVYKKIDSFSLGEIETITEREEKILSEISNIVLGKLQIFFEKYDSAKYVLNSSYKLDNKLQKNNKVVETIKDLMDSVKDIERYLKPFMGTGKEEGRDEYFYSEFENALEVLSGIDRLYNKIRNYVTKEPFSKEKFKLYFQNPQFMGGWDRNKEADYRVALLRKEQKYYLAIMDKSDSKCLQRVEQGTGDWQKMNYKLISGASKSLPHVFFSKKYLTENDVDDEILRIYESKTFIKGESFNLDDCHKLIDYYKESIKNHPWGSAFDYSFSDTKEYADIHTFYQEVDDMGYKISFNNISEEDVNKLVDEGKLYLFQIYNKDFSEKSHGTENLHTMYFKALFDENNEGRIRLCGGAEMFLRRASLKKQELVVHPANMPIKNKNANNPKKTTTLPYDVYKDKRYSEDQYEIHIPIIINKATPNLYKLNLEVRKLLREDANPYVIGIDRGERNLLYVVVIDGEGRIVEQYSLNEIVNECKGITIKTDYHSLLDEKEKERMAARKSWKTVENIKELKEGYISQVVHKICELVCKYDAVIALEDLNSGFKNSRVKVEKQVYQKFEKMLIDKLNYMVDKKISWYENGGVLKGFQLTNKFDSFKKMGTQNGMMFYIPAWLTSKIDPSTGFVNLLRTKYSSVEESRRFVDKITSIRFDKAEEMFVFELDYENFQRTDADFKKKWTLYSYGDRIKIFRNPEKNNEFDFERVIMSEVFMKLFDEYRIEYRSGKDLKEQILEIKEKKFFEAFMANMSLMLQMRNSITGRTDVDYLISPVKNSTGCFYDSREYNEVEEAILPRDADANGAYNIARKVLWAIEQFKDAEEEKLDKTKIAISNKEWLKYAQQNCL